LPLGEISEFPDHPFKVRMDEEMEKLVESVREHGVLLPALVRPMPGGGYQMVSGHRRKKASELVGVKTMPCIVRELSYDEAVLIMIDANLQRERILPSERAFAYKMKLEAMKRQGERTDLTSSPLGTKFERSSEAITAETGDSRNQIHRYIRLTNLISPLLDMVDDGKIAFRPAVELSYLSQNEQQSLLDTMSFEDATPSLA
jgi:ParB family chromosome partitioning protein